jgi:hypothetical protein
MLKPAVVNDLELRVGERVQIDPYQLYQARRLRGEAP